MTKFPLYGVVDIGSNAVRILFANIIEIENKTIVYKNSLLRLPLRLGKDVYKNGKISSKKTNLLLESLKIFESSIRIYKPKTIGIYATAAFREAENADKILKFIKKETGFNIIIIDGQEEARIIKELYENKGDAKKNKLFCDLGGGSLELTVLCPNGKFKSESFKIGAVRALTSDISKNETIKMHNWIDKNLPTNRKDIYFIGSGGNINTMKSTFSTATEKYLTIDKIKNILETLEPLKIKDRVSLYHLKLERADVIVPAAKIFIDLMEYCRINKVYVPGGGLSDGLILQLHKKIQNYKRDYPIKL